jgi:2-C-methyl-D-erythritol 4-phosphate cytidylyltransferase
VRPVTDTVKVREADGLGATVDRDGLVVVCSPVVLPAAVVAALDAAPDLDFVTMVEALEQRFPVERVEAPPEARRVASEDDVALLAALTEPVR